MRTLVAGCLAAAILVAVYCVAYTWLAGRPESFGQSLAWALANVCPWLLAIELGKRARGPAELLLILFAATAASILAGYALGASDDQLSFELWRRAPSLIVAVAAVALLRSEVGGQRRSSGDIPLLPRQIDWIRAAGNYVELRAGGRTIVHRTSISAAERDLERHGFIRIHRSTLVRRDRIARVRPQDVVLHDGTHLPVGKRYRASLAI